MGGLFPQSQKDAIEEMSKGNIHYAADVLQWGIVEGLGENFEGYLDIATCPFIGSFPFGYKKLVIRHESFHHRKGSNDESLGFINLYGLKPWLLYYVFKSYINRWIECYNETDNCFIIFYSAQTFFLKIAKWLKNEYPLIHISLIVPDLPEYMDMGKTKNIINRIKKRKHIQCCEKNIDYFDSYTLLTKEMATALHINSKRHTVLEGIANVSFKESPTNPLEREDNKKRVVYTGTLTRVYGVMDLVNAFDYITEDNYELYICGEGETKEEIIQKCNQDHRIHYLGRVSREQSIQLQQSATILVNPRNNNDEFTKYSFPSKLMEYLASGRPILCYRLDGIPREYDSYLNYIHGNTSQNMATDIMSLCNLTETELNRIGEEGKQFVLREKNCITQTKKIIEMITN